MDRDTAPLYIRDHFQPNDRLAVVLLHKPSGAVTQRIATADRIASPEFQAWLRHENAQRREVYLSMNTLRAEARGRTKEDIDSIRHIYLDFDTNGTEAVSSLMRRDDLPQPNFQVSTSPDKWQIVWSVEGFSIDEAERLQRWLARETGADPAATDAARVLRLPGFYNHKYQPGHFVTSQTLNSRLSRPDDFPEPAQPLERVALRPATSSAPPKNGLSQSERDWAFAKRALARGEAKDLVTLAIAALRREDKHDPLGYAQRTVTKAAQQLASETSHKVELTNHDR